MAKTARKSKVRDDFEAHARLIDDLGGPARVAVQINAKIRVPLKKKPITPEAVTLMKHRGVTQSYRPLLAQLARASKVQVPKDFLLGVS